MIEGERFDMLFVGAYTRDTVVIGEHRRTMDGGAFYYGATVAARMGLSTAAVTRLAGQDMGVVHTLRSLGVRVAARETTESTHLRLQYSATDLDDRVIHVDSSAGSFTPDDLQGWGAQTAIIGASFRGEVGEEVLRALISRGCRLALDVQGYVRVVRDGKLVHEAWPDAERMLPAVSILKADVNEAELFTGTRDLQEAAFRFVRMGAAEVLLTSNDGVLAADRRETHEAVFLPRRLVGRSGRGDTCLGAYAASRLSRTMDESLVWAAAVTSCKLEGDGPFQASMSEVESRAREIRAAR